MPLELSIDKPGYGSNLSKSTNMYCGLMKRGMVGPCVEKLQLFLKRLSCCQDIEVDGRFGKQTERFVKEFQKSMGLEPDGKVGFNTWFALQKDIPKEDRIRLTLSPFKSVKRYYSYALIAAGIAGILIFMLKMLKRE